MLLILAGEAIFILPFVIPRVFRPSVLELYNLDNTQLGLCFSVYGLVALGSYFLGGPLADKYVPRKLIATALWLTGLGGLLMATFPSYSTLQFLYAYWGFTTIFLFWAAMIKATRVWGGHHSQGKAFGILDGGRGLTGALFGAGGVFIFSMLLSDKSNSITVKQEAFSWVIYSAVVFITLIGFLVWFFMKSETEETQKPLERISLHEIKQVLKLPAVWLLSIIILCAYFGYKTTDIISQFANEVMLYNKVKSAQVGSFLLFLRPLAGITIGFVADKFQVTKWLFISFIISLLGVLLFASGLIKPSATLLSTISVFVLGTGVYALRALYFAVMQKGNIPLALTGTAVGIISLLGYTPDIFGGPLMGVLLDGNPGTKGFLLTFYMLGGFLFIGAIASWIYHYKFKS